eukprot:TRINITY_DN14109_c0_g1_i1.p1 TRINITY_DN14109_c0_g1~~TRINITY_DN14109_c0_g1_i1.p1  ORF type:complete len:119 (-),score=26.46 TRINITY_DN14109_c0_g1_i1:730-1086(-)
MATSKMAAPREFLPCGRTLDNIGAYLLQCFFAAAFAALMYTLLACFGVTSDAASRCGDEEFGYTMSGVVRDCRLIACFAFGAATCMYGVGGESLDVNESGENSQGGRKVNLQLVSLLL